MSTFLPLTPSDFSNNMVIFRTIKHNAINVVFYVSKSVLLLSIKDLNFSTDLYKILSQFNFQSDVSLVFVNVHFHLL